MKNTCRLLSIAALLAFAVLSPTNAEAQLPGGYASASAKSKEVVKAAKFAVKYTDKLDRDKYAYLKVLRAQQQVVAGWNYDMCVQFKKMERYQLPRPSFTKT